MYPMSDLDTNTPDTRDFLNLCGLTRKEAAEILGVSANTIKAYQLGNRGYSAAQQALLVSAGTGLKVEGVSDDGQKVDVSDTDVPHDRIHGPFTVSTRIQATNWSGKIYELSEWAASKVDWMLSMPRDDAAYPLLWDKPEWDLMPDGYARGIPVDDLRMRQDYRTPGAYFRILHKELGRKDWGRVTKEDFDNVDWKKLDLPRFEKVGAKVRSRLRSVRDLGTIAKVKE